MAEHSDKFRTATLPRLLFGVLAIYATAMFLGTHWPKPPFTGTSHIDKLLHLGAYFGLGVITSTFLALTSRLSWRNAGCLIMGLLFWGMIDELLQMPVRGRSADWRDWIADAVGATLGVLLVTLANQQIKRSADTVSEPST